MPIRFRCQYCHQLLGIARRKAGSTVHCPTCNASLLVPGEDEASSEPEIPSPPLAVGPPPANVAGSPLPPLPGALAPGTQAEAPAPAPAQDLFDRDDFDALLKFSVSGPVEPRKSAASSVHTPVPATRNPPPEPAPPPLAPLPKLPSVSAEPFVLPRPAVHVPVQLPPGGVLLTPTRATVLTVAVILLVAVAFGAGLVVGRFL
jgi:hypothetical protein